MHCVCNLLITLALADDPLFTLVVYRVLVSRIARIKRSLMDTPAGTTVQVVVVVINLENFESRHVCWIEFGGVGKTPAMLL